MIRKPYVAASSYLNAAPLCYSFIHGAQKDSCLFLSDAAPAKCAELLDEGGADAALIPVIEYQRIKELRVVEGVCVSSKAAVRSVVLASRTPIEEIRSVALDTSSRTSAALVQILLRRFYGLSPVFGAMSPNIHDMLESNDAALVIGDPAMLIDRSGLYVYDLAVEWKKHTGLPFVFAFWAIREQSRMGRVDFVEAKREGVNHITDIAAAYSRDLNLPVSDLLSYLTDNISYDLDDEALRGLRLFYELAHESGLIDSVRDVKFT
jgi:chorismate dehydratase